MADTLTGEQAGALATPALIPDGALRQGARGADAARERCRGGGGLLGFIYPDYGPADATSTTMTLHQVRFAARHGHGG